MASGNSNYDAVATKTLQDHSTEIFDAVVTNNALLWMLKRAGNIKISGGGRKFTHPLLYQKNTSYGAINKYETIPTPVVDTATRAEYDVKIVAGSAVLSVLELAQNAGNRTKLLDVMEWMRMEAQSSMSEEMGDQVFNDGSDADGFGGLQQIIHEARDNSVGGITSSSTNAYWRNYSYDTVVSDFDSSSAGLIAWNTVLNECTFGRQGPTSVFTTKTIYQLYEIALTANLRHVRTDIGDAGFRHLTFATLPVFFDDNCPTGNTYFVDTNSLWLQLLARGNFKFTPFQPSHDQLTKTALFYVFGNLTCGSRRTQGVVDSTTG